MMVPPPVVARLRSLIVSLHRDERGLSLPELLVGIVITGVILVGTTSVVFSTNQIQQTAADRTKLAGELSVLALAFDRDTSMATSSASAKSQTTSTSCSTAMNLGWTEGGGAVRYQTVTSAIDGPNWLQRISGSGTRTIARWVSTCSWQAVSDSGGRRALNLTIQLTGPGGGTIGQTLRGAPRLW
jgi:prepilin-type N-terminal cleavage/methylation domain-containing protein